MNTLLHHQASVQATADETALLVARGQIRHLGHIDSIKQTLKLEIKKVLIGIGSANKVGIEMNPFSAEDREQILIDILKSEGLLDKCSIYYLMDFGDNDMWRKQIDNEFERFSYVVSDNDMIPAIFKDKKIIKPEMRINIRGTTVRNAIYHEDFEVLGKCLHPTTFAALERIDAYKKIQRIFGPELMKPKNAVDVITKTAENKTRLIKRRFPPLGYALAGGIIGYGETAAYAALREGCEELGGAYLDHEIVITGNKARRGDLEIEITQALGYKDDPKRDPRGHVITFPFEIKVLGGIVKAGDDAKIVVEKSEEEIKNIPDNERAFLDHKTMILDTYKNQTTDFFLSEENCINRLIEDYVKHGSLAIAYDYDNTVFDYHNKGYTFENIVALLREAKDILGNSYFSVFTANEDHNGIRKYLREENIPMDGINQSPPFREGKSEKPYYNLLLDDRAGLPSAYRQLKAVIEFAKKTQ